MNVDLRPTLENDLVHLRALEASDFDALFSVAADPQIWEQHQDTQRYTYEGFSQYFQEALESKAALKICTAQENTLIGSSRFKLIEPKEGVLEIGWTFLARKYWGGTYNRAVKKLMINYGLDHFSKVVFYVNRFNLRSQKALEKLGAIRVENGEASWTLDPKSEDVTYLIETRLP